LAALPVGAIRTTLKPRGFKDFIHVAIKVVFPVPAYPLSKKTCPDFREAKKDEKRRIDSC